MVGHRRAELFGVRRAGLDRPGRLPRAAPAGRDDRGQDHHHIGRGAAPGDRCEAQAPAEVDRRAARVVTPLGGAHPGDRGPANQSSKDRRTSRAARERVPGLDRRDAALAAITDVRRATTRHLVPAGHACEACNAEFASRHSLPEAILSGDRTMDARDDAWLRRARPPPGSGGRGRSLAAEGVAAAAHVVPARYASEGSTSGRPSRLHACSLVRVSRSRTHPPGAYVAVTVDPGSSPRIPRAHTWQERPVAARRTSPGRIRGRNDPWPLAAHPPGACRGGSDPPSGASRIDRYDPQRRSEPNRTLVLVEMDR